MQINGVTASSLKDKLNQQDDSHHKGGNQLLVSNLAHLLIATCTRLARSDKPSHLGWLGGTNIQGIPNGSGCGTHDDAGVVDCNGRDLVHSQVRGRR